MSEDFIDYSVLVDEAMHVIVQKSLEKISKPNFKGEHHFFISFMTQLPGVQISEKLRKKYPSEMTIVLQYQFEELKVNDKGFSVVLSFDNIRERVVVPFSALTAFADPSVKFGLQLKHYSDEEKPDYDLNNDSQIFEVFQENDLKLRDSAKNIKDNNKNNVVALDQFRKKK